MRSQFDEENGDRRNVTEVASRVTGAARRALGRLGPLLVTIVGALLLATGFYKVEPGEIGVIRTFGRESGQVGPGLHYRVPLAQEVDAINVEAIRRIEVGFHGDERIPAEAQTLTGDENIVEAQMIVQYRIAEPSKTLFRLRGYEDTLHAAAEVALRSIVGRTAIDDVMTTGRETVQEQTRVFLQKLVDDYQSGLRITEVKLQGADAPDEVKEAFHDVVRAREEKDKLINQAKGYEADRIPRARGEAAKQVRDAEAYKEQRVKRATGDAEKFELVLAEYKKAQVVTRERLYLETMERVFDSVDRKVFVDKDLAKGSLPVLQLGGVAAGVAAPPAAAPAPAGAQP